MKLFFFLIYAQFSLAPKCGVERSRYRDICITRSLSLNFKATQPIGFSYWKGRCEYYSQNRIRCACNRFV